MILAVSTGHRRAQPDRAGGRVWSCCSWCSRSSTGSSGPALEIDRYAKDILDGGIGIAKDVDGVDELARTRDLVTSVPPLAVAYLEIVKKELPMTVALAGSVETAWWVSLAVGLVVALVVWFLLEWLRRTVNEVDRAVDDVWMMGKRVAQNTATTHMLVGTKELGVELLEEVKRHGELAERRKG